MKNISLKFSLIIFLFLSACSDSIYKMHPKRDLLNLIPEEKIDFKLSPIHKAMYDLSIKLVTISKSLPFLKGKSKPSSKNPEGLNQIISTEKEIKEVNFYDEGIQEELHGLFGRIQRLGLRLKRKFLVESHEKEAINKIMGHFLRLKTFFDKKISVDKLEEGIKELSSKIQLWEDKLNNWN